MGLQLFTQNDIPNEMQLIFYISRKLWPWCFHVCVCDRNTCSYMPLHFVDI